MASIRQRDGKWQVRVRRRGFADEAKTFNTRTDAERWARSVETEMDRGSFVSRCEAEAHTLEDIINLYITDVCPTQRSGPDDLPPSIGPMGF
ncbi:hypothetical protein [Burkholderia anthina]|uniref:Integrase n=1 Tax=Burkholderia anthina TaxID=179879 RepID=A0A7T6VDZ3_9BURK|nr:hypothetical protein [Burkholderia anthina]QQK02096.1 hypothetical protein JFN94_13535 [Burkholderia anthina]